jgi:superfamily II DNA or RNA helicase
MKIKLRDYQQEVLDIIDDLKSGSYLIQMATGLGKTATFTNIKRKGRVLVLAHREELITQPIKYYNCPVGIEMASQSSNNEEVIIASVMSLTHRLEKFNTNDFDMIIIDEAHHAAAKSYKKIIEYFEPRLLLGFTATPNRR